MIGITGYQHAWDYQDESTMTRMNVVKQVTWVTGMRGMTWMTNMTGMTGMNTMTMMTDMTAMTYKQFFIAAPSWFQRPLWGTVKLQENTLNN